MDVARKLALAALSPLALICVAVIRIAARYGYLIRFGELFSSRIGHLAGNLECYLCERDAGMHPRGIDIWVPQKMDACNAQLLRMVRRTVRMWPAPLVRLVSLLNCMFDGWQKHIIDTQQHDRDIYNLYERFPPHLAFTKAEQARGKDQLAKWGIASRFVCLIVRDGAYLSSLDYHRYRDSDIATYREAALALAERGYTVFRMGAKVAKTFKVDHPRVIDYATNGMRSDFMDVYLAAHCAFCVTSGTGLDAVCASFRRPMCFVNYAPFEYLPTWFAGSLAIWKHYEKDGKRMTVEEIAKSDAGHFMRAEEFEIAGIKLADNTPEEIRDAVLEMEENRLYLRGNLLVPGEVRQTAFWARFPRSLSKYNQRPLHGEIRMRIGAEFLKGYQ